MTRVFDAATLPLDTLSVIEASAGTGKTHSLALLYVRAIVERALLPEQVLVVTFGVAATAELGERLLRALDETLAAAEPGSEAHVRLAAARAAYERRAVYTLHGFCHQLLREFALELGAPPRARTPIDDGQLRREAAADLWHARMTQPRADEWYARFPSPEAMLDTCAPLLRGGSPSVLPERVAEALAAAEAAFAAADAPARALWGAERDAALAPLLGGAHGLSIARDNYHPDNVARCVAELEAFFAGRRAFPVGDCLFVPERLEGALLQRSRNAGRRAPAHALFDALARLEAAARDVERLRRAASILDAARAIGAAAARRARALDEVSYDALVDEVAAGLDERLAAALARRWPVALLDECQDTDAQQYSIFRRIYAGRADAGLVLVGDPKQAIYRFRGGDVFAYALALADAPGGAWSLATNHRSTRGLVEAVNALFAAQPFALDFVRYEAVDAAGPRSGERLHDDAHDAALVLWDAGSADGTKRGHRREDLERWTTDACAGEIVRLLDGSVRIGERPVAARDVAVLVPSNRQVEAVVASLRARGVAATASARENVFGTESARELHAILAALCDPGDERLLRGALIGPGFELDAATLARAASDAAVLAPWRERFAQIARDWRRDGTLAALAPLIDEVAASLLAHEGGERRLVDWRQLAELLAGADAPQREPEAVLAWLARRLGREIAFDDAEARRREPGAERVRVMTLHQSKGLQFPIVFAPMLWWTRWDAKAPAIASFHDAGHRAWLDLGSERFAEHAALAQREHVAEQVRLTYVALTRAVHRCYAAFGKVGRGADAGLARVLFTELDAPAFDALDAAAIRARLERFACGTVLVTDLPVGGNEKLEPARPDATGLRAAPAPRVPPPARVWSYSALKRLEPPTAAADARTERRLAAADDGPPDGHGARFGECFHALLEVIEPPDWPGKAASAEVAAALARHGLDAANQPMLERLIGATFDAEVAPGARLRDIAAPSRARELPLLFALERVDPRRVAACLAAEPAHAHLAALLERVPARLDGWMRGYIDLAFAHDGRFYLLDYKTDTLHGDGAYAPENLAREVQSRGYDLQYLIYAVALKRWLRARGIEHAPIGVVYVFARGLGRDGAGVFRAEPDPALLARLDAALAGEGA